MSFDRPLWLLAIPVAIAASLIVHRWGTSGVGARQRTVAMALRITLLSALILALAGLRTGGAEEGVAVVFVVDRSDSVSAADDERAQNFISQALEAKQRGDRVAVVAFGKEPRLEFSMTDRPEFTRITAAPDGSGTDLARALRLAGALFPEGTKRRIVVFTDGRETAGDARREAARLAREGVAIEGLTLGGLTGGDSLIEALEAPAKVRRGERYRLGVTVRSPGGPARLDLYRDGARILSRQVQLRPGRSTIPVDERATGHGLRRYEARLRAAADVVPYNDRAAAAVLVQGPPRVLVLEAEPGDAGSLLEGLRAGRLIVERADPADLPDLTELLQYSATVLVDVPADRLTAEQVATLKTAVRDAGMGLLTIGGEDSYGLGGYRGSELESLLPVDSDIRDPKRKPSVAEALVIDTSGSMAQCHCRGGQMQPGMQGDGINKTDISRAGAARAIRALSKDDTVGVLAFNTTSEWVLPLQKVPSESVVRQGLQKMHPQGGTAIPQALRAAVAGLRQTKTKLKHIILFTDGWTEQSELVPLAAEIAKQGITLSVVATGEGTGEILAKMAEAGRGRFYAGTDIEDVPQVMMQEAILASRNFVNEGVFSPVVTADTAVTENLRRAPSLLGYVATSAKPTATVDLEIGAKDPLLASWRAGLGTVASWTSDSKARWSRPWVRWQGYRDFWTRAVRSTFAPSGSSGFGLEARIAADRLVITVAGQQPLGPNANATARIVSPSLRTAELALERTGPASFGGTVRASEEGTYLAQVTVRDGSTVVFSDRVAATRSYSAEYLVSGPDPTVVPDLVEATRARARITPPDAFDPEGLQASPARRERWPLLALLAGLLLPVDIAARRLTVGREDLARAKAALRARREKPPAEPERPESVERLFEAKRRVDRRYRGDAPPEG